MLTKDLRDGQSSYYVSLLNSRGNGPRSSVFIGEEQIRGFGFFDSLLKSLLSGGKSAVHALMPSVAQAGSQILTDYTSGADMRKSLKRNLTNIGRTAANKLLDTVGEGQRQRRRKTTRGKSRGRGVGSKGTGVRGGRKKTRKRKLVRRNKSTKKRAKKTSVKGRKRTSKARGGRKKSRKTASKTKVKRKKGSRKTKRTRTIARSAARDLPFFI